MTAVSETEVAVEAPALGKLNVRASPDNCEVFVDGAFVDYPPILDRPAVVGADAVPGLDEFEEIH